MPRPQHRIGGGTTKLALADRGRVLGTAAFHVGGRLMATDGDGAITVLEPGGKALASHVGLDWNVGDRADPADIERLAGHMADAVLTLARGDAAAPELAQLWLSPPLDHGAECDAVVFSGGVSEYVYGQEHEPHGDLGAPLGKALRAASTTARCPPAS